MRVDQHYFSAVDYYLVMGVGPDATSQEISQAFETRSEGLKLDDPNPQMRMIAAERMLELTQAYEILSDPIQRSRYDLHQLGRKNLPVNVQVDGLFKEAIKAFKQSQTELALRYFKEITLLYPHRPLYRVHLAICYAEKNWLSFAEAELETALRLDPDYMFAKETVARLLFKLPDKKVLMRSNPPLNRQVATMAAGFVTLGILLVLGLPQQLLGNAFNQVQQILDPMRQAAKQAGKNIKADNELRNQLPQDMMQELQQKQAIQGKDVVNIPELAPDFKPEGQVYDYRKQKAKSKTFYPDQGMVVVTYEDGSILTYRPAELQGWKEDAETKQAVMVTRDNELIPAPASLPLKMPDGSLADLGSAGFPAHLFPEYAPKDMAGQRVVPSASAASATAEQPTTAIDSPAAGASSTSGQTGGNPYSPYAVPGGR